MDDFEVEPLSFWRKKVTLKRQLVGVGILVLLCMVIFAMRVGSLGRYKVISNSMQPTLAKGDYVFVDQRGVYLAQRGDIVVFDDPEIKGELLTKRVIGLPGERVKIERERVYIDDVRYQVENWVGSDAHHAKVELTLGPEEIFVMGDNRLNSQDSLYFGGVDCDDVRGRVFFVYWPPSRLGAVESVQAISARESDERDIPGKRAGK
jgi:signal peptidase I